MIVTGATGLLGSEVIRLCPESLSLSSKDCDLVKTGFSTLLLDLEHNDVVIHCAAKVGGVKANSDHVADFFDDNMRINMNVLETCKSLNLKLVSILSTCVYPDADYVSYPLTEEQLHLGPPHQSNFGYAYAKRMLEVQSRAYRQQHGCNFITVIPNNLYGANDNYDMNNGHVIPSLVRKFYEAKVFEHDHVCIWGSGRPLREFTFARDAAEIVLWLSENYDGDEPVNIGNPEQISIIDLANVIAEEIGYRGKIIFDKSKPDGQYQKPSSNKKLLSLGWSKSYTPLREGLRETIESFVGRYPHVRGVAA